MTSNKIDRDWSRCTPGALDGVARNVRSRRRNALLWEAAAMIVLAASIGFTAGYFAQSNDAPSAPESLYHFAGISCAEVHKLLPALADNRLDAATAARVREHAKQCPQCRRLTESMPQILSIGFEPAGSPGSALAAHVGSRAGVDGPL